MKFVSSQQLPPKKLGDQGEVAARRLLENKGYRFLTGNFRTKFGEIDLIFQDREELVFVEVKARTKSEQGLPEEAVNRYKLAGGGIFYAGASAIAATGENRRSGN